MQFNELTGRTKEHLTWSEKLGIFIHQQAEQDFLALKKSAWENGLDLQVASGFRGYERQKKIWNEKAKGIRPVLDRESKPLTRNLPPFELAKNILTWSALPGASRHHWGTDFDVFCFKSLPTDYKLKLTPKEYGPDGVLSTFSKWLRENLEKFNFFFPYQKDLGGVMPEPWHIAHGPSSTKFMKSYSLEIFKQNLLQSDLELKKVCKENSLSFYQNYFQNISPNPWEMNSIS